MISLCLGRGDVICTTEGLAVVDRYSEDKERIFLARKAQDGEHFAVANAYDVRDITCEGSNSNYSLVNAKPSANIYGSGVDGLVKEAGL